MTIQNTTIRKAGPSQGNGVTTVFPFTFKVFTATDILVTYLNASSVESVLVLTTNYTVSLNADQNTSPGGSVTLLVAPATATYITLTSQVTNTQTLALTNSGGFYPESINNALDRTVIEIQQLAEKVSRTVSIPTSSTASVTLPIPAGGNVIGWNATATALTNLPAASGTSLVSLAASTGSTLVGTTNGGTGTVTRTVAAKLNDRVSVKDFGAVGDGVTDDTVAIQAAITHVGSVLFGGVIHLPSGIYRTTATIYINYDNITLLGDGSGGSGYGVGVNENAGTLITPETYTSDAFSINCDYGAEIHNLTIRIAGQTAGAAISIAGASGATPNGWSRFTNLCLQNVCNGIYMTNAAFVQISDCYFLDHKANAITIANALYPDQGDSYITGCSFISSQANAVHVYQTSSGGLRIINSKLLTCKIAVWLYLSAGVNTSDLQITGCSIEMYKQFGVYFSGSPSGSSFRNILITGCQFLSGVVAVFSCIYLSPSVTRANDVTISGNVFSCGTAGYGVYAANVKGIAITGNSFFACSWGVYIGLLSEVVSVVGNAFTSTISGDVINGTTSNTVVIANNSSTRGIESVASAAPLQLPDSGNVFLITGTTAFSDINSKTQVGRIVTLKFAGAVQIYVSATNLLAGNFLTTANDTLTLMCDGTAWNEIARSIN